VTEEHACFFASSDIPDLRAQEKGAGTGASMKDIPTSATSTPPSTHLDLLVSSSRNCDRPVAAHDYCLHAISMRPGGCLWASLLLKLHGVAQAKHAAAARDGELCATRAPPSHAASSCGEHRISSAFGSIRCAAVASLPRRRLQASADPRSLESSRSCEIVKPSALDRGSDAPVVRTADIPELWQGRGRASEGRRVSRCIPVLHPPPHSP
jgi:hypothetical protein